jgi:Uma2 family endonuclease
MAVSHPKTTGEGGSPQLCNGDRMNQQEFHYAYEQMPPQFRAELLGGIVFEPSPLSYTHARSHAGLSHLFSDYAWGTAGTEVADNATVILSDEDEVQPDLLLRISHKYGGRSRLTEDDYVSGAPELVAEVALSSRAIDLHLKKERYALSGVLEYIVVCLRPKRLYWFDLGSNRELSEASNGVVRSVAFPGFWIHREGLLQGDPARMRETLNYGLQSDEHVNFVSELAKRSGK